MASPSVTYTFSNGTTADAGEVNTNFTDILNAMTNGTKTFSIDALTCAGSATFNGAVNLGNATSDDLTFTGYAASAIVPKANNTYALGSASLGWSYLYLGNATYSVGLLAPTLAASYTLTLPTADGSKGQVMQTNGSGVLSFVPAQTDIYNAGDADYTVTDTDGYAVIKCAANSVARVVTLPTAADNTDRRIRVINTDGTAKVTVKGEAAGETVGGISGTTGFDLIFKHDYVEVVSDGSVWWVLSYREFSDWKDYTPTINGMGSVTGVDFEYRRVGDSVEIRGKFTTGTPTAAEVQISLPNSWTIGGGVATSAVPCGRVLRGAASADSYHLLATDGDTYLNIGAIDDSASWAQTDARLGNEIFGGSQLAILQAISSPVDELLNTVPNG